jgi:hypothetical protein
VVLFVQNIPYIIVSNMGQTLHFDIQLIVLKINVQCSAYTMRI